MANYFDRDNERYRNRDPFRGNESYDRERGQRFGPEYEGDRGWEVGRSDPRATSQYDEYERGYGAGYLGGHEQGRGFSGGRDVGRFSPSYNQGFGEIPESERRYGRPYGASAYRPENERYSGRQYEGTNRPPDYGRDFATGRHRTYGDENLVGERDWIDRASDEISSWFGDDAAERRRRMDKLREGKYRGRGPKGYRRSDERIKEDVNDRLTDYSYLDASEIVVSVKDGDVTLSGTVLNRGDKRVAEAVAESVSGVKNVQNNLRLNEEQVNTAALETSARAAAPGR